jgi:ATPase family associated with various cellular activities (AAA)
MSETTPHHTAATPSPLVRDFKAARFCSVPLVAIETADPAATVAALLATLPNTVPVVGWDLVRGLHALNEPGAGAVTALRVPADATINPVEAFNVASKLPQYTVLVAYNAHHHLKDPGVMQAVWILRDLYKTNRRTFVALGPSFQLPAELAGDLIVLDEPFPTRADLGPIVDQLHTDANLPVPTGEHRAHILDAVVGVPSAFTAEQVVSMALDPKAAAPGVQLDRLWAHKIKAINAVDGLGVWKGGEAIADLQGIDAVKGFMQAFVAADAFGVVVFIDELDKALAGGMSDYSGDSGVSKDQVGTLLSYIEDTDSEGVLLAGLAGTGKSALAKATGNAAGKVTIRFDLGAMKGGTVGQSERQIRNALKVITATAEGRVLFIGTANNSTIFTPEINRRFGDQFFFDLPDAAGRAAMWPVYIAKYGLTDAQLVNRPGLPGAVSDEGWTGAEIKRVCKRAARLKITVAAAAQYLVPSAVKEAAKIDRMRAEAAGRFLSANRPGFYTVPPVRPPAESAAAKVAAKARRMIEES